MPDDAAMLIRFPDYLVSFPREVTLFLAQEIIRKKNVMVMR
ncbi:Thymidine phosphorylase [Escherichia coli ISC41]|nr:Thymidine phosphorylase [Escherichia coli ISC41]